MSLDSSHKEGTSYTSASMDVQTFNERLAGMPNVRNHILAARHRMFVQDMLDAAASCDPSRVRTRMQGLLTQAASEFARLNRRFSTRFGDVPIRHMGLCELCALLEPVMWGVSYALIPSDNDDDLVPADYVWGLLNETVRAAFPSARERNSAIFLAGFFLGYHVYHDHSQGHTSVLLHATRVW